MKWIAVQAEVTDVRREKHWVGTRDDRHNEWFDIVEYRYRTPDTHQTVTATDHLLDQDVAVPGQMITVHLDPDDTTVSHFRRPSVGRQARGCGCVVLGFLGMLAAIVGALALWFYADVDLKLMFGLAMSGPLFLAGVVALVALTRMFKRLPRDWPEVSAVVTGAAKEPDPDRPGRARRWITIYYAYRDHLGFERTGSGQFNHPKATIERGDEVTVRVDPQDGSRSILQPASPKLLKVEMGLVVGLMLFAVVMAVVII